MAKKKIIIGYRDVVSFPLINMHDVPVKIDSGAYTSSIHYFKTKEIEEDGVKKLKCYFLGPKNKNYREGIFVFDKFKHRKVRSSNGISEIRYSIKTQIDIFGKSRKIELTLSKRSRMKFTVLIGRKFLKGRFVIDSSLKNLSQQNIINTI